MDLFPASIVVMSMKPMQLFIPAVLVSTTIFAQSPSAQPEFEVASIKAAEPIVAGSNTQVNIGIHIDGAQWHANSFTLKDYIRIAYQVKDFQVICPDWAGTDRFDISAKIPAGMGREKTPQMLQALLGERFGMKIHHDKKEFPVFGLVVSKKEKLKESAGESAEDKAEAAKGPIEVAGTGGAKGVNVNYGHGSYVSFADNKLDAMKLPMPVLADWLSRFLDRPVVDMTELAGNYDYKIEITEEEYRVMMIRSAIAAGVALPPEVTRMIASATDESLYSALAAYGLKLEPRKAPLDVIVVDHVDKTPTAN
jgi:uncharacterized protein (TIGR03435 family)